jgi:hypothetical protein
MSEREAQLMAGLLAGMAGPHQAHASGRRIVCNSRPGVDWNTCGQAAIATVLAHMHLGPFAAGVDVPDGEAIDWVRHEFPADVPLGLGTSAHRLAAALRAHGLAVERVHSGWFALHAAHAMERLVAHVETGYPVPVCIDMARLGSSLGAAHWAIVTGIEGDRVRLGNVGFSEPLPRELFLDLWRCRWLPYGHNHAAVLAWA